MAQTELLNIAQRNTSLEALFRFPVLHLQNNPPRIMLP